MKFVIEVEPIDIQAKAEMMADMPLGITAGDVQDVVEKMQEIIQTRTDVVSNDFWIAFDSLQTEAIFQTIYERMF